MGEEGWSASSDTLQPSPGPAQVAAEPLELLLRPTIQIIADASENRMQPGLVEVTVVVDPSLHDGVDPPGKVAQREVTAHVEPPASNLPADPLGGGVADRGSKAVEQLAGSAPNGAATERVTRARAVRLPRLRHKPGRYEDFLALERKSKALLEKCGATQVALAVSPTGGFALAISADNNSALGAVTDKFNASPEGRAIWAESMGPDGPVASVLSSTVLTRIEL